nr:MAG TPA: hypothetical protein [Caudoviricetes sp.]
MNCWKILKSNILQRKAEIPKRESDESRKKC